MQVRDKSWWYLIDFAWDGLRWIYRDIANLSGNITMHETDGLRYVLQYVETSAARETLGVFLSMDGNVSQQVETLCNKCATFGLCLSQGGLTHTEARIALRTTIWKTLEYPMETITLTSTQWHDNLRPLMTPLLRSCGFARSFKYDILFGPPQDLGLHLKHPFANKFVKQLQVALNCTYNVSVTRTLLLGTVEQLRLELGFPGSFADVPFDRVASYTTSSWWTSLLSELDSHKVLLHDNLPTLLANRDDDCFLLPALITAGYRGKDLRRLSTVRKFLEVTTLSDICDVAGRYLMPWAWDGTSCNPTPHHVYQWLRHPPSLSAAHWSLWRAALSTTFCNHRHRLNQPLGPWFPGHLRTCWPWMLHPSCLYLYVREGLKWRMYSARPSYTLRLTSRSYKYSDEFCHPLPGSRPCSVNLSNRNAVSIFSHVEMPALPVPPILHFSTIDASIAALPLSERWALHQVQHSDEGADLAVAIMRGDTTAISDGSFKAPLGTSASLLRGPGDCSKSVVTFNRVAGSAEDQSSYRSELAGILGSLLMLEIICCLCDITGGSAIIGLEGQQALLHASDDWPLKCTQPQFDLLKAIRTVRNHLPIKLQWQWIHDHQDETASFGTLDPLSQDNVIADSYAKSFFNTQVESGWQPSPIPLNEGWYVTVSGMKVASLTPDQLYSQLWKGDLRSYWSTKFEWAPATVAMVDWDVLGHCSGPLSFSRCRLTTKLASGLLGVGRQMRRYGYQDHDNCPRCDAPDETTIHVLCCQSAEARSTAKKLLARLRLWMESNSTHPGIVRAVHSGLSAFFGHSRHLGCDPGSTRRAFRNQSLIRWRQLLYGFASSHWQLIQRHHLASIKSRRSSRRWTIAWLRQLMQVSWNMWDNRNHVLHNTLHPAVPSRTGRH